MLSEEQMTDDLKSLASELDALATSDFRASSQHPPEIPGFCSMTLIGRGGMGDVYRARQISLGRDVALKFLMTRAPTGSSDEARMIARLHHPNIIHVYAAGETNGIQWFTMELADGTSASGRTFSSVDEIAQLGSAVAEALVYAHRCGILHRDVKPSNIFLGKDGTVKLGDFGLARQTSQRSNEGAGTERFMAPELLGGAEATEATDQYALGMTLRELSKSFNPLPPDFAAICAKASTSDPTRRYANMEAMRTDLKRFLAREPVRANPSSVFRRLRLFSRRDPFAATGLAAAGLLLVAFISALTVGYVRTNRALKSTRRVAREAAHSLAVALAAADQGTANPRDPELRRARHLAKALARRFPEDEKIRKAADALEKSRTERERTFRPRFRRNHGDIPR